MGNFIYKKNYTCNTKNIDIENIEILKQEIIPNLKLYDILYKKLNHIILPLAEQNFHRLVSKLDNYVKEHRGTIEAVIDYENFGASIKITSSFFDFTCPEDYELIKSMTEITESITFSIKEEKLELDIIVPYFECIMPKNNWELEKIKSQIIKEIEAEN